MLIFYKQEIVVFFMRYIIGFYENHNQILFYQIVSLHVQLNSGMA